MIEATPIGLLGAFGAGVVSFLSPCVAPLVPGYLALISGSASVAPGRSSRRFRLFKTSLLFVLGFSLVFVTLGASMSIFGDFLFAEYRQQMARVAGFFMILMGIVLLWGFRVPFLMRERKYHLSPHRFTASETLLLGMAFGAGWTPCFGPILASILAFTSTVEGVHQGTLLLTAYSLGLGLPFLIAGLSLDQFQRLVGALVRRMRAVTAVSGVAMLVIGFVFLSGRSYQVAITTQKIMNQLPGFTSG